MAGRVTACLEDEGFGGQSNDVLDLRVSQRELEENLAKSRRLGLGDSGFKENPSLNAKNIKKVERRCDSV